MTPQPHNIPIGPRLYKLEHDYAYEWTRRGKRYRIFVPAGFIYDGASVPRLVWTISGLTPDGLMRAAALIHDYLYEYRGELPTGGWQCQDGDLWRDVGTAWTREQADKIFETILRESGVSAYRRKLAYAGVRAGGWAGWKT